MRNLEIKSCIPAPRGCPVRLASLGASRRQGNQAVMKEHRHPQPLSVIPSRNSSFFFLPGFPERKAAPPSGRRRPWPRPKKPVRSQGRRRPGPSLGSLNSRRPVPSQSRSQRRLMSQLLPRPGASEKPALAGRAFVVVGLVVLPLRGGRLRLPRTPEGPAASWLSRIRGPALLCGGACNPSALPAFSKPTGISVP